MGKQNVENGTALGTHGTDSPLLRSLPYRVGVLQHGLTFGRKVQTASPPTGGWIHDDMAKREEALQIAGQRRLLDIEFVADLDSGDAVTRRELGEQRVLACGDAEWAKGIIVDPRDDTRELTHTGR